MTFKEKLKLEHPDKIDPVVEGGCVGCPCDYGYAPIDEDCGDDCYDCWNREIPVTEPTKKPFGGISNLADLIERAGTKKDISITIFIHGETTSISIYPHPDPSEGTKNPVAEAYKALVAGDTASAITYLGEAIG